jgi:hypothetical protein
VARNLDCGFLVAEATSVNVTDGGSFYWNVEMGDGYYLDVDAGTITTSNGFTALNQGDVFAAEVSGFTNANPGVITASNVAALGFAAGDTINVSNLADDQAAANSLNGQFTVASVTATTITLVEDTSSGYSAYVSGGLVTRVSDASGDPVAYDNVGVRGVTLGTGVVGGNNDVMVAICKSQEPVV